MDFSIFKFYLLTIDYDDQINEPNFCSGQSLARTTPSTKLRLIGPKSLESLELLLLSPSTHTWFLGMFTLIYYWEWGSKNSACSPSKNRTLFTIVCPGLNGFSTNIISFRRGFRINLVVKQSSSIRLSLSSIVGSIDGPLTPTHLQR